MQANPNGMFYANMNVYGSMPSKAEHAAFSRDADLMTVTVLNDPDSARMQRSQGVPYVVYRQSEWEPDVPRSESRVQLRELAHSIYRAATNLRLRVADGNIHIMVNCEQDPHPARYTLYVEMMHAAMTDPMGPVGMVFSNVATGVLKSGQRGEANDWAHPARLEYLKVLDQYRNVRLVSGAYAFIHGTHGYTALYPWIAVNGGKHQIHNWSEGNKFLDGREYINWGLPQDHLGREFQGMMLALGYRWNDVTEKWDTTVRSILRTDNTPVEPPWSIVTEELIDAMNDVRYIHRPDMTFTAEFPEPMGYRTLESTWKRHDWFPGQSPTTTLARFLIWAWQVVYEPTGYFIGKHYYASGATGPETRTHNISHSGSLDADFVNTLKPYRRDMPDHFFKNVPIVHPPPIGVPPKIDHIKEAVTLIERAEEQLNLAKAYLQDQS